MRIYIAIASVSATYCFVRSLMICCRSYDGKMFATGGTAGIIRMWSLHATTATLQNPYAAPPPAYSLHRTCEVQGHSKAILGLAFSLDDKQIVSVGEDGAIFVWTVFSSGDS